MKKDKKKTKKKGKTQNSRTVLEIFSKSPFAEIELDLTRDRELPREIPI